MPTKPIPAADRFWNKVAKTNTCWLWTGGLNNKGYGELHYGKRNGHIYVHRFSWVLHNGSIPGKLFVLHRCDTRHCVRPDHLFLGTQADNLKDAIAKGRMPILVSGSDFHRKRAVR